MTNNGLTSKKILRWSIWFNRETGKVYPHCQVFIKLTFWHVLPIASRVWKQKKLTTKFRLFYGLWEEESERLRMAIKAKEKPKKNKNASLVSVSARDAILSHWRRVHQTIKSFMITCSLIFLTISYLHILLFCYFFFCPLKCLPHRRFSFC